MTTLTYNSSSNFGEKVFFVTSVSIALCVILAVVSLFTPFSSTILSIINHPSVIRVLLTTTGALILTHFLLRNIRLLDLVESENKYFKVAGLSFLITFFRYAIIFLVLYGMFTVPVFYLKFMMIFASLHILIESAVRGVWAYRKTKI